MKIFKVLFILLTLFLSACASYNDVKLQVLDAQSKEPLGDTYVLLDEVPSILPSPFRQQKIYKTDSNGELIISRGSDIYLRAIKAGYEVVAISANPYSDPTKAGFIPKTLHLEKSKKRQGVILRSYVLSDYDTDPFTKDFIDYCFANKIKIRRSDSRTVFELEDDR